MPKREIKNVCIRMDVDLYNTLIGIVESVRKQHPFKSVSMNDVIQELIYTAMKYMNAVNKQRQNKEKEGK